MIVYLNGKFLPLDKACISPLDRGFLFGDGIYEVIPAYAGHLFRIEQHLQRLQNSLDAIQLKNPYSSSRWTEILHDLMDKQAHRDHSIYLQITRGADTRRDHSIPTSIEPTVFIMSTPLVVSSELPDSDGICAITREDSRWQKCNIKAITLLANILHKQEAIDEQCTETILIRNGYALEGSASNLFVIKDKLIQTPPKGSTLLPGITRDLVLEIARQNNMSTAEVDIPAEDLFLADEIWITSSTREVLPVTRIDGKAVGDGKPGPIWGKVVGLYQAYKKQLVSMTP